MWIFLHFYVIYVAFHRLNCYNLIQTEQREQNKMKLNNAGREVWVNYAKARLLGESLGFYPLSVKLYIQSDDNAALLRLASRFVENESFPLIADYPLSYIAREDIHNYCEMSLIYLHSNARRIASEWYNGQWSELYKFVSTGLITPEIVYEVQNDKAFNNHVERGILLEYFYIHSNNGSRESIDNWNEIARF